jgi:hypothetical protein
MTGDPAPVLDEPEVARGRPGELPGRLCLRCGAFGTHYLTCPDLRLPSGYRLGDAPRSQRG